MNMTYSNLVIIEAHLNESIKGLEKDIFASQKLSAREGWDMADRIARDTETLEELKVATAELKEYETYIANHG